MSTNGESGQQQTLELRDVLVIQTTDEKQLEFEVVGLVEDEENNQYAVLYCEAEDEFVVSDAKGTLLDDDELAQEILDDFSCSQKSRATKDPAARSRVNSRIVSLGKRRRRTHFGRQRTQGRALYR